MSGSVSASASKVNSDYASVTEQSALRAGGGGFDVKVKNDTDLKGGAITSTQQAIDDNKNAFHTDGELTLSDIDNKASYSAKSASINIGTGFSAAGALVPQGTSMGFGKDSGSASSTTRAAISGIAGNTNARTGDKETGVAKIFDAAKVQKEIEAQTKITQMFGQLASKAVGDFAVSRSNVLKDQARQEGDSDKRAALYAEARLWDDGGAYRVALHAAIGGLAGGTSGALGAGAVASAAPLLNELQDNIANGLKDAGAGDSVAKIAGQLISGATAAGIGAAVGGGSTAGASIGLNVDANNRQLHPDEAKLIKENAPRYATRRGIGVEQAVAELTQQAERQDDSAWATRLGSDNEDAQAFLKELGQGKTLVDSMTGQTFQLFTADAVTRDNHAIFAQYIKTDPLVRAELDLAMNQAFKPKDAQTLDQRNMSGSDMALNDAARDYGNMKTQPANVQWAVLGELRQTRGQNQSAIASLDQERNSLSLNPANTERRTELASQIEVLQTRDQALLGSIKAQLLDMGTGGSGLLIPGKYV
ncbi:hypothetical protein, partial [Propionivibrio sp.]|uniref:hypothetical protein n=1 Tax=Propionivibrio sp. TaxID=2212460 RepID=UPI0025CD747B